MTDEKRIHEWTLLMTEDDIRQFEEFLRPGGFAPDDLVEFVRLQLVKLMEEHNE